ncbi:hypothetical protein GCM10009715_10480 [Paeniglutamicibacter psychrophenolicus]|uniref:Uncharacterized protein n=1 Tax=Paeniglutamicibacter psychrophenolicus TaxID=257454 RepID=A0ABS4WG16_9MICC|nr:hypothetical protein [Paeniglutamicibacter psychrophenolicus]MBP2375149.1 hypothetical protein [Paeniglutamicibacter psychrophenolicus]MDQ0094571.1 hypothetical protein [Paeniglutamicibacter psychrophenolicus]
MSFNIGNQTAGVVNNVAGNQWIYGDQRGKAVGTGAVREAVRKLRGAVDDVALDDATSVAVSAGLVEIESELEAQEPERSRVRDALEKVTVLLTSAGAIAAAGQALVGPITSVASWVGSWGPAVAHLLRV